MINTKGIIVQVFYEGIEHKVTYRNGKILGHIQISYKWQCDK